MSEQKEIEINSNKQKKNVKKQRKESLRRKNVGVVGKIDVGDQDTLSKNTKIRFDDEFIAEDIEDSIQTDQISNQDEESDSETDDEVEQVSSSAAKEAALKLLATERQTRKVETAISNKRKRKSSEKEAEDKVESDDDLDEDFFAMVDSARENDAKLKKLKNESNKRKNKLGRHTTFVSEDSDVASGSANMPIHADANIDVVILPTSNSISKIDDEDERVSVAFQERVAIELSTSLSTKPSNKALLFCRGSHSKTNEDGDYIQVKRSRKMKYSKNAVRKPNPNFAIRKMNLV